MSPSLQHNSSFWSLIPSFIPDSLVLALALKAYRSHSLTPLGITASIVTGLLHTRYKSLLPFVLLAAFYLSSSKFTKLKAEIKAKLTTHANGQAGGEGPRNATQVFANSVTSSILIAIYLILSYYPSISSSWLSDDVDSYSQKFLNSNILTIGIISHYAAVCADTWSSELGILSSKPPILITTLKPCPKGTNGGVSSLGLSVAIGAGAFIGFLSSPFLISSDQTSIVSYIFSVITTISFFSVIGLFGSVLDSILGATCQQSVVSTEKNLIVEGEGGGKLKPVKSTKDIPEYKIVSGLDILSNNQVNLLTSIITSLVGMTAWYFLFL